MKTLKINGAKIDSFETEEELIAYIAKCIINCPDNSYPEKHFIKTLNNDFRKGIITKNERNNMIVSDIIKYNDGIHFQR
jgi:hypothetical protein